MTFQINIKLPAVSAVEIAGVYAIKGCVTDTTHDRMRVRNFRPAVIA